MRSLSLSIAQKFSTVWHIAISTFIFDLKIKKLNIQHIQFNKVIKIYDISLKECSLAVFIIDDSFKQSIFTYISTHSFTPSSAVITLRPLTCSWDSV